MTGDLHAALLAFADDWEKIPPLVRAAQAAHLAEWAYSMRRAAENTSDIDRRLAMDRRANVAFQFAGAAFALTTFAAALARIADDEAIALMPALVPEEDRSRALRSLAEKEGR